MTDTSAVITVKDVSKTFGKKTKKPVEALKSISFSLEEGKTLAIVGADAAGKTTLLRIMASLLNADSGEITVDGRPHNECRIGYMPQKFGLYEDLSLQENLDLFADLNDMNQEERKARFKVLLDMAGLAPFTERLAGDLSGGMKQKLGLICTLINPPRLLLLDEPTVGVDPFSRKELWNILKRLTSQNKMCVIVSTPYLDEAQICDQVLVLHEGIILQNGTPQEIIKLSEGMSYLITPPEHVKPRVLQSKLLNFPGCIDSVPQGGAVRFVCDNPDPQAFEKLAQHTKIEKIDSNLEDSVMLLLHRYKEAAGEERLRVEAVEPEAARRISSTEKEPVIIETKNVFKKFGDFAAVNDVSFSVRKGEVFGLLGPNGAGKTTTFKMLCGLSKPTAGHLTVNGVDASKASIAIRKQIGYVAQKFSLYDQLTIKENLNFFAGTYGLWGKEKDKRQEALLKEFSLGANDDRIAGDLPGGYKRRLSMAAALQHSPPILFLDEPTSGADPIARREFWQRITKLAEEGVTVVVTTHFMEEAEYCDHLIIQDSGKMIAHGTPGEVRNYALSDECPNPTMEDAFVAIVTKHRVEEVNDG